MRSTLGNRRVLERGSWMSQLRVRASIIRRRTRSGYAKLPSRINASASCSSNSLGSRIRTRVANQGRAQSGLLSQLLNPDPNMLPPGHHVASDRDVTRTTGIPSTTSSKSPAALRLAAQITAQAPMVTTASSDRRGGYRPKGRPQGEDGARG